MNSILLTAEEICAVLGIGRATWYRWKNGDNPPPAFLAGRKGRGGAALYDPEEVKAWRRQREADGPLRALVDELPDILAEAFGRVHTEAVQRHVPSHLWDVFDEATWHHPSSTIPEDFTGLKPEGKRLLAATLAATWSICQDAITARARELGIPESQRRSLPADIKRLDKLATTDLDPEEEFAPRKRRKSPKRKR